jgi:hypothetical protein
LPGFILNLLEENLDALLDWQVPDCPTLRRRGPTPDTVLV